MSRDDILLEAEMSMEKSVDYMVHEFAAVRTGKASPGLVENVDVHAYGSTMKLKQLALITTPESRLLVVQPFDAGTVQDIERALKESKIGIMPAVDGKIIRLPIPELSEERRKELVRSLGKMAEEARVRVRNNRRSALDEAKKLKAAGVLTEDGFRDVEDEVQKLTDRFVKSVDDHLKHKVSRVGFGVAPKRSFLLNLVTQKEVELTKKVHDREDALANTRDACATQPASGMLR